MITPLQSTIPVLLVATLLTGCWGTPGRQLWLQNECGAPVAFIVGEKHDRLKDTTWDPTEDGQPDVVASADLRDPGDYSVAIRWVGDHSSDKLITIPAEAWRTKEPDGDPERDDLIATLAGDLCPNP